MSIADFDVEEVVYSPEMADKSPTTAVISERLGNAIGVGTKLGIAFVGVVCAVGIYFNTKLGDHGERLARMEAQSGEINKKVDRLLDKQAKDTLLQSFPTSIADAAAPDIKDAAIRVRERGILVPPEAIHLVSQPLLTNVTPAKWEAVTQLLNLRAFVNSTLQEAKQNIVQTVKPGEWTKARSVGEWVQLDGAMVVLDGKDLDPLSIFDEFGHAKKILAYVIFKNTHVIYRGGKVTLINVFFENCTFELPLESENARRLAIAILEPPPFVKFTAD